MISVKGVMLLAKLSGEYRPPSTEIPIWILKFIILAQLIAKIQNGTSNAFGEGEVVFSFPYQYKLKQQHSE